jgi:tetratricopeptide (TPR) repeat protein
VRAGVFLTLIGVLLVTLCSCEGTRRERLERLLGTEIAEWVGGEVPEDRVTELSQKIVEIEDRLEQTIQDVRDVGVYYRLLGIEYMDDMMFGPALDNFQSALEIYPRNKVLSYYAGLCSANLGVAHGNLSRRNELFERAERHYRYAVSLDGNYVEALYGLSILYVFEMDRPMEALSYVERILMKEPSNIQALFLLARLRVLEGEYEGAVEIYDEIAETAKDPEMVQAAEDNKEGVLGEVYEGE